MAEFVRAQIFGTCFEITSRSGPYPAFSFVIRPDGIAIPIDINTDSVLGMLTSNPLEWEPLVSYGTFS